MKHNLNSVVKVNFQNTKICILKISFEIDFFLNYITKFNFLKVKKMKVIFWTTQKERENVCKIKKNLKCQDQIEVLLVKKYLKIFQKSNTQKRVSFFYIKKRVRLVQYK